MLGWNFILLFTYQKKKKMLGKLLFIPCTQGSSLDLGKIHFSCPWLILYFWYLRLSIYVHLSLWTCWTDRLERNIDIYLHACVYICTYLGQGSVQHDGVIVLCQKASYSLTWSQNNFPEQVDESRINSYTHVHTYMNEYMHT